MPSRRAYVISLGLLLLVGAPIGYTRWLGRSFPADTTVEGAYLRVVLAVDNDALGDAFAYLETEAQWACHTTFDYHKKIIGLLAAYPEPERAAALARYPEAAQAADAPALFAKLARSRGWEARLRRDLSGVGRVEEQGERATLETARGTRYAFRRRENGIWGLTMFTGELRLEAERAARDAALVERAAADYRAAAGAGSARRPGP
ncbi:MAG TPA: hypothetical protein VFS00_10860 [Polyangiaceae bacterium]|nr:hypothetical protein [Polyangiaceae bacterium]